MPFVSSGGVRIHYEVEGSGAPLVLHTGAGGDCEIWKEAGYLDGLREFRVIRLDQRGRGKSDRPTTIEAHRIEHFVDDLTAVLDAEQVRRARFWGYSSGLLVGIAFGAARPDRLGCVVGTGTLRYRNLSELPRVDVEKEIRDDVAAGGVAAEVDRREQVEGDKFPPTIDANVRSGDPLMHALDGVAWLDWEGPKTALERFHAPMLLIAGEKEDPDRATEQTVRSIPGARLARVPGVGHLSAFSRSDLTLPIALPFLRDALG